MNILCKLFGHKTKRIYNVFKEHIKTKCTRCPNQILSPKEFERQMQEAIKTIPIIFNIPKHYLGIKEKEEIKGQEYNKIMLDEFSKVNPVHYSCLLNASKRLIEYGDK